MFGLQQFVIGQPYWETYLKGEEADPKAALQKAVDAVAGGDQARLRLAAVLRSRPAGNLPRPTGGPARFAISSALGTSA